MYIVVYVENIWIFGKNAEKENDSNNFVKTKFKLKDTHVATNTAQTSRPDILYAMRLLSRFNQNPGEAY